MPNKATKALRAYLQDLFREAFTDPAMRARLLKEIKTGEMDRHVLRTLLEFGFGRPGEQADPNRDDEPSLAALICGKRWPTPGEDEESDDRWEMQEPEPPQ